MIHSRRYLLAITLLGGFISTGEARQSPVGNATFTNPTSQNTSVTVDTAGDWFFQISAFDGVKTTTGVVKVTFNPSVVLPKLSVGGGTAIAGTPVNATVTLATGTNGIASLQFDLDSPMVLSANSVTAGSAATAAGKSVSSNLVNGDLRVIVSGLNQTMIGAGPLAVINLQVPATQAAGSVVLNLLNMVASDANGVSVPLAPALSGVVVVTANQAPIVTLGAGSTVTLPAPASLTATATDDGAPNPPGAITYTWSVL